MQPEKKRPLPAPSLQLHKRSKALVDLPPSGAAARENVGCSWPGCSCLLPERRLDSDLQPLTHDEFVARHAPITGKTVRWDRAPMAAQYCQSHIEARFWVLTRLKISAPCSKSFASSAWLHLHPEADRVARDAMERWLDNSKFLYASEHPGAPWPDDSNFHLSDIYCLANKFASFVGAKGTCTSNRWTYDPRNFVGDLASNRRLLLHGAPFERVADILNDDLGLSGMEVNSTSGQMLGEGLYLADSFMKSLKYAKAGMIGPNRKAKVVFVVEANIGKPMACSSVSYDYDRESWKQFYEDPSQQGVTRKDVSHARGKRFFADVIRLQSGWACGCRVPALPSFQESPTPCLRSMCGHPGCQDLSCWKPLLFNEWCVHNTQKYSLAYMLVLERRQA